MAGPTNALTYNLFVQQIADLAVVQTTTVNGVLQGVDDSFNALIPSMLNYSELRIQRDTDLLPLLTSQAYTLSAGNNILQIPVGDFVTLQTVGIVTGTSTMPLQPVSKEYIQNVWGDSSVTGPPLDFSMYGGDQATAGNTFTNVLFGPYPDLPYVVSVTGIQRMPSLYLSATPTLAGTATTFISAWLPDLLVMASMIYVTIYQRNFGMVSNDPQMGSSYEMQYENLLKGALVEEARKRYAASGWSSMSPALVATPSRG